ncbi:MAG: SpoIIE family protein phosphatase [Candidatus Riflebacteria bacterium]|nr:SpoIIE family protein phosphatase [Candidatus Riflebacteria bacterium]
MILTTFYHAKISSFLTSSLPENIRLARMYEQVASEWVKLNDHADECMYSSDSPEFFYESGTKLVLKAIEDIEEELAKSPEVPVLPQRLANIKEIKKIFTAFSKDLDVLAELLVSRTTLQKKRAKQKTVAAQTMQEQIDKLLQKLKATRNDLSNTLKTPDFQKSIGTTSLLENIKKIGKDLEYLEGDLEIYLASKMAPKAKGSKATKNEQGTKNLPAIRLENRLRAMLYLLERSIAPTENAIQRRVLMPVESKVKSFYDDFLKLRNTIEAPESDLLSADYAISDLQKRLVQYKQDGTRLAYEEAEKYLAENSRLATNIETYAQNSYYFVSVLFVISIILGLAVLIKFPSSIGKPLKKLNRQVSEFKLGSGNIEPVNAGITEIDTLSEAFGLMAERLNLQGEINKNYMESIHSLTSVYKDLHDTKTRPESPNDRIETAVTTILQQLVTQSPNIDLVKVMVSTENPDDKMRYFKRIGEPEFSDSFRESKEFKIYCESTDYDPVNPANSKEEIIPEGEGLTGWYFENSPGIKTATDDKDFFKAVYSPHPVSENPILKYRKYEMGLEGCLITEILNVSDSDPAGDKGILFIYFQDKDTKLSWQEIFFIQIIARQLSSVIETDRLLIDHDQKKIMDDQLRMAKEIQDNLLPQRVPEIPGLALSRINQAAAEVGGDYFDFFELGNNRLGAVIADASGKNVPAAIIMTVFKTTLSTMELSKMSPSEVLTKANKIVAKNITNDRFITAMYVIADPNTGTVQMASAGHNPAYLVSRDGGRISILSKNIKCIPLGILDDYEYEEISFKMNKSDLLVLYTDGVTEARNADGEEYGEERLKYFLAKLQSKKPAKDILAEIQTFSMHAKQHDDITAVTIEFT